VAVASLDEDELQWSRRLSSAEGPTLRRPSPRRARFNGAADFHRRKALTRQHGRPCAPWLQWSRRLSSAEGAKRAREIRLWRRLQWSRRLSSAEGDVLTYGANKYGELQWS